MVPSVGGPSVAVEDDDALVVGAGGAGDGPQAVTTPATQMATMRAAPISFVYIGPPFDRYYTALQQTTRLACPRYLQPGLDPALIGAAGSRRRSSQPIAMTTVATMVLTIGERNTRFALSWMRP